jgi:small subunit ribosomal protein S29
LNFPDCDGTIPPHDIALPRLFMKYDGHRIKNGVKVMSTSETNSKGQKFDATQINLAPRCEYKMKPLEVDDFRSLVYYYHQTDWIEEPVSSYEQLNAYMVSQGNFFSGMQYLKNYMLSYY